MTLHWSSDWEPGVLDWGWIWSMCCSWGNHHIHGFSKFLLVIVMIKCNFSHSSRWQFNIFQDYTIQTSPNLSESGDVNFPRDLSCCFRTGTKNIGRVMLVDITHKFFEDSSDQQKLFFFFLGVKQAQARCCWCFLFIDAPWSSILRQFTGCYNFLNSL